MLRKCRPFLVAALAVALAAFVPSGALAQSKSGKKIICWKDKAGKVVGCGDSVPPEYQDNATKELDKRGITRKTTETADERAKREAEEKRLAVQKADDKKRAAEQRRQDQALLHTFTNEKEIDLKRDRDLQVVDGQLTQLKVMQKNAAERQKEVKTRIETTKKTGKPASETQKEDLARADADMSKAETAIATREKEKDEIRARYAGMKERYIQLRGGAAPSTAAAKK